MKELKKISNKGAALVTVIMVMMIAMIFAGIVLTYIVSQTKTEVNYEEDITALHSAEAGLNEYLWDLNNGNITTDITLDAEVKYPEYNPVAAYKLTVDPASTTSKKIVTATGWMLSNPETTRTIHAIFTEKSFARYVYFTNTEGIMGSTTESAVVWYTGSQCFGPYHTNNTINIQGNPEFFGKATYTVGVSLDDSRSLPQPSIFKKGCTQSPREDFPPTNTDLMPIAASDNACYNGLTCIKLNADGTMNVRNQERYGDTVVTVPLPEKGVVYVNGATSTTDTETSNMFGEGTKGKTIGNVFVSGELKGRLTIGAANDIYITNFDPTYKKFNDAKSYRTRGVVYARTTFSLDSAEGTGIASDDNDMLGLIANRHVVALTRGWFDNSNAESAVSDLEIDAAIVALKKFVNSSGINGTNPAYPAVKRDGSRWKLIIRGSVAQDTRGAVGTVGGGGYTKDYAHDNRMLADDPPFFIKPEKSGWEISDWTED